MIFGGLRHDSEPRSAPARIPDAEAPRYDFDDERARTLLLDIRNEFGLDYEKQEFVTLRKIERFCRLHGLVSFEALEEALKSDAALKERLINRLTVGETYFYREPEQLRSPAACRRFRFFPPPAQAARRSTRY